MSSQSGILATKELLDTLNDSEDSSGLAIFTAKISADSTVVERDGSFNSVEQLQKNLNSDPLYIFVKNPSDNLYVFASYVPDGSPVRAKMLYASTKNTLIRQVGSNSIGKQLLFTEAQEVRDILDDSRPSQNAVLTESEKVNIQIAQQQQKMKLAQHFPNGKKLVSQTNGAPSQLSFEVDSKGFSISSILNKYNAVSFTIDLSNEQIHIASKENVDSPYALRITAENPSYTIFKNGSLHYFIYSCPSGSKVKDRMVYASNRAGFVNYLTNEEKLAFAKIIEIGEPSELEVSLISSSSEEEQKRQTALEKSESKPKFNRPSGPGRRSKPTL
ncbi:hypothetical protein HG535_0A01770 [Zygotorulaspora mrakii]|uniref:ADF-H domain-containing protein n=1 Tax=Zygotorulaspora mrakii TaxID=42260 RepID=A0A7H9AWS8_ZYGMR|nr:uncharacterized protein HG535_0A01770 [Zygotorulaspora mrakii]QLG70239.1 hypothetical protein HG535_0A01770 [Zygotorulaspora mrakii]